MFLIKKIYIFVLLLILSGIFYTITESFRKKTRLSFSIAYLEIAAFLAILTYLLTLFLKNIIIVTLLCGLHYSFLLVSLVFYLNFIVVMEEKVFISNNKARKFIFFFLILVVVDIIFLILNAWNGFIFSVCPIYVNEHFFSWSIVYKMGFHFHLGLCYLISMRISYKLIKDSLFNRKFYKTKYYVMLVLFLLEIITNGVFIVFSEKWKLDFSVLLYGCLCIIVFSFSIFSVPNSVRKNLLLITTKSISDAVICFDVSNRIIYSNLKGEELLLKSDKKWIENYLNGQENHIIKNEVIDVDNQTRVYNVEFRRIRDEKNRISGSYIKLVDETEEIYKMEIEEYKATHDELTGLLNRNGFFKETEKVLHETPEVERYFVCTNIKDFKLVNDLFGEEFGNSVLIRQAELLSKADFKGVIKGRVSGDKFAMIIPKEKFNYERAIENTNKLANFAKEINYQFKVCIGVYEIANPYENVHTMYDKANLAIKNISENYNTSVAFYDTSIMTRLKLEKSIISDFDLALKEEQFCMFLQPQIACNSCECVGAEALVRWYDSKQIYRHPDEFIPILEKHGLIYNLDLFIWKKAVEKLKEWQEAGINDMYISVNISSKDFYYADLYSVFTGLVEEYGVSPSRLNLEITESVLMSERKSIEGVISKLQKYGFKIEMDDFGSGYSSLNVLKEISMDVLKIDMEFLRCSDNERRANLVIASIVRMARALGMKTIIEGVENEQQAEFLAMIGVDVFQGYLFSKPLAVYDFEHKFLERKK